MWYFAETRMQVLQGIGALAKVGPYGINIASVFCEIKRIGSRDLFQ